MSTNLILNQNLKKLIRDFKPNAKPDATSAPKRKAPEVPLNEGIHPDSQCDRSGMFPIVGMRYNKKDEDYDVCEAEYLKLTEEEKALYVAIPPTHLPPAGGRGRPRKIQEA